MIQKIITNGRPGVARGALDAALVLDIPHGGWMPANDSPAEDPLPDKYHLQKVNSGSLVKCSERNVKESDGTLILTFSDDLPDDALCARKCADKYHSPWLQINLGRTGEFEAARSIHEWLKDGRIQVLHVVGTTHDSLKKNVAEIAGGLLEAAYYLELIENNMTATTGTAGPDRETPPDSIDEIVSRITADMTLKDRVIVSNLQEPQLERLHPTLERHIIVRLENWQKHHLDIFALPDLEKEITDVQSISAIIIKRLWGKLKETHRLRMIK